MDTHLVSLFSKLLSFLSRAVVCIVDDDLATRIEEVPDNLFTSECYLLPKGKCFRRLLAYRTAISQFRTKNDAQAIARRKANTPKVK